jgi:hypothetical protein
LVVDLTTSRSNSRGLQQRWVVARPIDLSAATCINGTDGASTLEVEANTVVSVHPGLVRSLPTQLQPVAFKATKSQHQHCDALTTQEPKAVGSRCKEWDVDVDVDVDVDGVRRMRE